MASLNKLAIRGIRSFDDKHVQVIEFYSPLTVIVGHNGSGKTTIIECLNYVTSGILPPGSKTGGAFIHDPKMANEKEVKAQVRLRFWNVNRQRMTATRNLQVTMKKGGGLTMKTLEGLLAKTDVGDDNKRNTISTKCSEMDEEVPLLLGVSKAILENVIFCHQEESNWPLSEPATLKKKFDDIFEATKYTKALDNIKALKKERTAELKLDKERLSHAKSDKDKAEKMRKQLEQERAAENAKATEAEELKIEVQRLKDINMEYYGQAATFQSQFDHEKNLKEMLRMKKENQASIIGDFKLMNGEPTDELQDRLKNFDSHLKTLEAKRAKQIELREKEAETTKDLRNREHRLAMNHGSLVGKRSKYEEDLKAREATIKQVAADQDIAGYDYSPLEESRIAEFVDKIHELVKRAETDYKRLQADGARQERAIQAELDRLAGIRSGAVATKKSKQDQIVQINNKIRSSEASFDSVSSLDVEIELLQGKIAEAKEQRGKLEQDIRDAKYDEQLRDKNVTIRQKEADKDKLSEELSSLNRQADSRAKLAIKRGEVTSKEGQVAASVASHRARFKELVGTDLEAESMEDKISLASRRRDREVQEAESSAAAASRSLSQLQTSYNIAKRTLKEKSDELSRLEKQLSDGLKESGKESAEDAIKEAETELKIIRDEMNSKEQTTQFWQQILERAQSAHKCMACDRDIQDKEIKAIESYMLRRINNSKRGSQDELKEDEQTWMAELETRRGWENWSAQITDLSERVIPPLEKQVEEEGAQIEKVQEEVEESKIKVQKAKLAARDLQTLRSAATLITRTLGEIKDLKAEVVRLERDLAGSGSLKTVDEVQHEVNVIANEIKNLQREAGAITSEKELKTNAVRSHSDDISEKTLKLGELKGQLEKRNLAEAALKDLHSSLAALQAELKDLDQSAQAAEAPWKQKIDEMNRYRTDREAAELAASAQVESYKKSLLELEAKHNACQSYLTEGNDRKIRENEAQMEDTKREIATSTEALRNIDNTISSLRDDLGKANNLKSTISANLRHRSGQKEIAKLEEELDGIDLAAAARTRREFNTKYAGMLQEEQEKQNKWSIACGELTQMTKNREQLEKTLKADYEGIDKQYRMQLIKTKIGETANNDLDKYGKALDNAILKYHSIKMDEINDTIGHLWNKTYQGTDIDGIRIVSDHDESSSTSTRKSYNYRVVMVKNDVELDMRGRCSAGQKVLASIIIRLALAESFGQGCGVLALDEPTTNLDQENINALAEALAEIIRDRRRQANFQLIVITHDEGFLNRLAAHDVLEYYWRVSRDASQKSTLERQRVGL